MSRKNKNRLFMLALPLLVLVIAGTVLLLSPKSPTPGVTHPDVSFSSVTSMASGSESSASASSSSASSAAVSGSFQQPSDWRLVLANSTHFYQGVPAPELTAYSNIQMDRRVLDEYLEMKNAAHKAGVSLWISSGYRDPKKQEKLFSEKTAYYMSKGYSREKAEEKTANSIARPGTSEHETGLAVDLNGVKNNFHTTKAYSWLMKNAADYGFVLRYPKDKQDITKIKFEPWHFRYVGREAARFMAAKNLCLEEYLEEQGLL